MTLLGKLFHALKYGTMFQNLLAATHRSDAWGVLQVSCLTTMVRSFICLPYHLSIVPGSSREQISVQVLLC
jgi:hypothetical protein